MTCKDCNNFVRLYQRLIVMNEGKESEIYVPDTVGRCLGKHKGRVLSIDHCICELLDTSDNNKKHEEINKQVARVSKDEYYLRIAEAVLVRSTCLRRQYGAVIVKNDEIISVGYNGSPRGEINCIDTGSCERQRLNIPAGQRYELCQAVHAEQNAIISAARKDMIGATMYIAGKGPNANPKPCLICTRMIKNAGIGSVLGYIDGKIKDLL